MQRLTEIYAGICLAKRRVWVSRRLVIICLISLYFRQQSLSADDLLEQHVRLLKEIRAAMAARDLPTAQEKLAEATKQTGPAPFTEQVQRLNLLYNYLLQFWQAVDQGTRSLQAVDQLTIGDTIASVVEAEPNRLVLRVEGQNRRYTYKTLPTKLVLYLAGRYLKPEAMQNKVFIGTFLAVDGHGDRAEARKLWTEAQQAGFDVSTLLPELEVARGAVLSIELPTLTLAARAALKPTNWQLRRASAEGWIRGSLSIGSQDNDGRLVLDTPAGEDRPVQAVNRRLLGGDFVCRVILLDIREGQQFGLFPLGRDTGTHTIALPAGSMQIEFTRQGDEFRAKVNGQTVEFEESDSDAPPPRSGQIGLSLLPGSRCSVAALEFLFR